MRNLARLSLISALILPVVACKGPTGVSGDKQLSELSEDEKKTACENIGDYYDKEVGEERLVRFGCIFKGAFNPEVTNEAECDLSLDACVAAGEVTVSEDDDSCVVDGDIACDATVEEYEACLDEQVEATVEFIDSFTCAAIYGEGGGGGGSLSPETGPLCTALAQKCPGLFSSASEG